MKQLSFDFETPTGEEVAALCDALVTQAGLLWEAVIEYNVAFQRLQIDAEAVAGCSLEDWTDDTLIAYASLCIEAHS